MAGPELRPAALLPAGVLHAAFGQAFADYLIGPFQLTPEQWPDFLARQRVNLDLSRAACDAEGRVLAFALVASRPGRWRLATMGAVPAARGSGAAKILLDDVLARAGAARQAAVELEVFAQNERALHLYRSRGFETRHELLGYQLAAGGGEAQPGVFDEVGRAAALAWLEALSIDDLPLQVGAEVLAVNPRPWRAWQAGSAQLVFDLLPDRVQLLSLIDANTNTNTDAAQADARRLVQALRLAHPRLPLTVPQLQRRDLGGAALEALGFERLALHQLLMRRALRG
jgi:ribosomal protein S18 acetylase RimI-like enzyme